MQRPVPTKVTTTREEIRGPNPEDTEVKIEREAFSAKAINDTYQRRINWRPYDEIGNPRFLKSGVLRRRYERRSWPYRRLGDDDQSAQEKKDKPVDETEESFEQTLLFLLTKLLLEDGADVNATDGEGYAKLAIGTHQLDTVFCITWRS